MDPALLILLLVAALLGTLSVATVGGLLSAGMAAALSAREWMVPWQGHELRVVTKLGREELWVDGELAASYTNYASLEVSLATVVDGVDVLASLQFTLMGTPTLHVFADGVYIGGDPLASEVPAGSAGETADDLGPQWGAAALLLDSLDDQPDARTRQMAGRLRRELRQAMTRVVELERSSAAHSALGQLPDDASGALAAQEATAQRNVQALFGAIQRLHLTALSHADERSTRATEALMADLEAELEVGQLSLPGARSRPSERAVAAASARRRQKQRS